ncbi:MAG: hypothetical protein ACP5NG_02590, partial [Conexivisphaera sp.]
GVISQAIERNWGGIEEVIVERKSTGSTARELLSSVAESRGIRVTYIRDNAITSRHTHDYYRSFVE